MGVIDLGELSDCHYLNLETASIDKWIFLHQNNSVSILECLALFLLLYFQLLMETRQRHLVCGHLNIWVCFRQRSRSFRGFRKYWGDLMLETEQLQTWCFK